MPGGSDRARERNERRARLVAGASAPEPVGAVAGDQGQVGEGLDVLDQCWARRRAPRSYGRGGTKVGCAGRCSR